METPFNENLLLSSVTGVGGLAGNVFGATAVPISPGKRNQYNAGLQQTLGRHLLLDADYFWKYTTNAFDYSILLNTTITFPIAWNKSKLDGVTGRISTTNLRGFQAYWTFGHPRPLLPARDRRPHLPGRPAGRKCLSYRSRPGVPIDRRFPVSAQERRMGGSHMAV